MNVLVATNMFPSDKNPFYGIFVKEQVESLKNEGIAVDLFFINGRASRLNYFTSILPLLKKLKLNHYDLIHAHHSYCIFITSIARAITRKKIPQILTFHEGEVHKAGREGRDDSDLIGRLVFSKKIKQVALKMADFVIAVQHELIKVLNFDGNYAVIPCGVNPDLFCPRDKKRCREKLNLPIGRKIVFFPASPNDRQKGIDVLGKALVLLKRENIYLQTAGNINHSEMPYYMGAADVVVQLSDFEASPMVLREAMLVNVPVVFTGAGDAAAIAGNIKGCFLSDKNPRDVSLAIKSALDFKGTSGGRRRVMEAEQTLQSISWKIIKVYNHLLAQSRSETVGIAG